MNLTDTRENFNQKYVPYGQNLMEPFSNWIWIYSVTKQVSADTRKLKYLIPSGHHGLSWISTTTMEKTESQQIHGNWTTLYLITNG